MATEKNKKFADLIVPFTACPFEKIEDDCPFINFWKLNGLNQVVELIDKLPESELLNLREHHNTCRDWKLQRGEPIVNL